MTTPPREPVAWMESPHGAIRANPKWILTGIPQTLAWSIPLYAAPPEPAAPDADARLPDPAGPEEELAEACCCNEIIHCLSCRARAYIEQQARELAAARAALCAARSYINESDGAEFASDLLAIIDAAKGAK